MPETKNQAVLDLILESDDLLSDVDWCPWGARHPVRYVIMYLGMRARIWWKARSIRRAAIRGLDGASISARRYAREHSSSFIFRDVKWF